MFSFLNLSLGLGFGREFDFDFDPALVQYHSILPYGDIRLDGIIFRIAYCTLST
jgi:hypothetical protein